MAKPEIDRQKGSPVSDNDLCRYLKLSDEDFFVLMRNSRFPEHVDIDSTLSTTTETGLTYADILENKAYPVLDDQIIAAEHREVVFSLIKKLSIIDQRICSLYYSHQLTLEEVGAELNLTAGRVHQRLKTVTEKLQRYLRRYRVT